MGFRLTELIIETVIRDGLESIFNSLGTVDDKIDEIFADLLEPHMAEYFGQKIINEIKDQIRNYKQINIVQTYPLQDTKVPMIGIFLQPNRENESLSAIDDFVEDRDVTVVPAIVVDTFTADSYNSTTGMVNVSVANINLDSVRAGHYLYDGDGNEFLIIGGIKNTTGLKHFFINTNETINLTDCVIRTSIRTSRKEIRGIRDSETIGIGILTQNQLMTKFLYTIIKYIILSNKINLINRGVELSTFDGSDLLRPDHSANQVFARFLNIQIKMVEHTWVASTPTILDGLNGSVVYVARDEFERDDEDDMTIQTIVDES